MEEQSRIRDLTARLEAAEAALREMSDARAALRDSEARLQLAFDVLPVGVALVDGEGEVRLSNEEMRRFLPTGVIPSRDPERRDRWLAYRADGTRVPPEDFPMARALRGDSVVPGIEMQFSPDEGEPVWTRIASAPFRENGRIVGAFSAVVDIDGLKRAEMHQTVLLAELQHRVRNILSVVRTVFRRSIETGRDLEEIVDHFQGRLASLARTQVVVSTSAGGMVDLENLIRDELLSVGTSDGPNLTLRGPDVGLPLKVAEVLGLAIHELTTNAVKFGALREPDSQLAIAWTVTRSPGRPAELDFSWNEHGVPAVSLPPLHEGFGRELIEKALPYQLGARTSLEFSQGGIRCRIILPLADDGAVPPGRPSQE